MTRLRWQFGVAALCAILILAYWNFHESQSVAVVESESDSEVSVTEIRDSELLESVPSPETGGNGVEQGTISQSDRVDYLSMNVRVVSPTEDTVATGVFEATAQPYNPLVELANSGNSVAAFYLHRLLEGCQGGYASSEELEAAVEELHQTRTYPSDRANNLLDDDRSAADVEANMRRKFERCVDVTEEMAQEADLWLERSSDMGNRTARDNYGQLLLKNDPMGAVRHYQAIWNEGGALGAHGLSLMYESGWSGQEPDRIKSVGYLLVAGEYSLLAMEAQPETHSDIVYQILLDWREKRVAELSPHEVGEALQFARDAIQSNELCCE